MSDKKTLVEVKNLKEYFNINTGVFTTKPLKAVDDVSFAIRKGETLGLVGESTVICGWLDEYLATLPQLDRQLFVGRYWYNHSVKELARHYGMTANAATKRITRAREGLRAYLVERGYTP